MLIEYICPHCGYRISEIQQLLKVADYPCRCKKATWSEFIRSEIPDPEVTG